jgi:hypothetical protein
MKLVKVREVMATVLRMKMFREKVVKAMRVKVVQVKVVRVVKVKAVWVEVVKMLREQLLRRKHRHRSERCCSLPSNV